MTGVQRTEVVTDTMVQCAAMLEIAEIAMSAAGGPVYSMQYHCGAHHPGVRRLASYLGDDEGSVEPAASGLRATTSENARAAVTQDRLTGTRPGTGDSHPGSGEPHDRRGLGIQFDHVGDRK
jgi:hypothetical protein